MIKPPRPYPGVDDSSRIMNDPGSFDHFENLLIGIYLEFAICDFENSCWTI
jgi:hypothetical protein